MRAGGPVTIACLILLSVLEAVSRSVRVLVDGGDQLVLGENFAGRRQGGLGQELLGADEEFEANALQKSTNNRMFNMF